MKIGFIGLGKMGSGLAQQLVTKGHEVTAFKRHDTDLVAAAEKAGVKTTNSMTEMLSSLPSPKIVWLMIPAGTAIDEVLFSGNNALADLLQKDDIVIDGGNSEFWESQRRGKALAEKSIHFIDAGVSGGPSGARKGAAIMVGGDPDVVKSVEQLFIDTSVEGGYSYIGESGSGHFVKMVHNAIEYGMMQAIAEGMELTKEGPFKNLDLAKITNLWNHGTVVRGFLMEKMISALESDHNLEATEAFAGDLGETRWAIQTAIDSDVPFDSAARALFARFRSRQQVSFAAKVIQALRGQFGGHKRKDTLAGKFTDEKA